MFKLDNFGVILFVSFSYKELPQCSFYENLKKSIFSQKIQKSLCITTKSLYTNSKFQTQLSRKLQRFRTCHKNKKCSIFMIFPNISFFHMIVTYWTGPLKNKIYLQNQNLKKSVKFNPQLI